MKKLLATLALGLAALGFALNFGELTADATTLTARIVDASGSVRGRATLTTGDQP